jgi:hypothetical protein
MEISATSASGVDGIAISGGMVARGTAAHSGGTKAGTSGVTVGVGEAVRLGVIVNVGVAVGGSTICVTKLHASRDKIKIPNAIRFLIIDTFNS